MEEILASIRRIISDDGALAAKETVKETIRSAAPKLAVVEMPAPPEAPVGPAAMETSVPDEEMPPAAARSETAVTAPAPDQAARPPLLSPSSDEAVQASFSQLAGSMPVQDPRTLEDVVTDMLRPMLKAWLDDNLPALVERLVREEIERVARSRR